MKRHTINSRLALSLSTLMLALLTACGGGGGDSNPVVGAPDPLAQPVAAHTVCGVDSTPVAVAAGAERLDIVDNQTWSINGVDVPIRLLTSLTGYPYDVGSQTLSLPMDDLRAVRIHGYTPSETNNSMGVEMGSTFAAGSVGCINSVSRITDNGTQDSPNYLVSWTSAMLTDVPVGSLPDAAINGFEYTHNFTDKPATAVFRISKDTLANTGSAQICHIKASGSVDCAAPVVTDDGAQWTLQRSISESGIYVLSAALETVPNF